MDVGIFVREWVARHEWFGRKDVRITSSDTATPIPTQGRSELGPGLHLSPSVLF